VTPPRYDPPAPIPPEVFAFYKKKARRLRLAARLRWRRQLCAWMARVPGFVGWVERSETHQRRIRD
jgi:hypothetical protein